MSENKTTTNNTDPIEFLENVENTRRREDGFTVLELMKDVTGEDPVMWGPTIIGFGKYHYGYECGR